jgi:hypothetical protein
MPAPAWLPAPPSSISATPVRTPRRRGPGLVTRSVWTPADHQGNDCDASTDTLHA